MTRVQKHISFDLDTLNKIEQYRKDNGLKEISDANEVLVLKALKEEE